MQQNGEISLENRIVVDTTFSAYVEEKRTLLKESEAPAFSKVEVCLLELQSDDVRKSPHAGLFIKHCADLLIASAFDKGLKNQFEQTLLNLASNEFFRIQLLVYLLKYEKEKNNVLTQEFLEGFKELVLNCELPLEKIAPSLRKNIFAAIGIEEESTDQAKENERKLLARIYKAHISRFEASPVKMKEVPTFPAPASPHAGLLAVGFASGVISKARNKISAVADTVSTALEERKEKARLEEEKQKEKARESLKPVVASPSQPFSLTDSPPPSSPQQRITVEAKKKRKACKRKGPRTATVEAMPSAENEAKAVELSTVSPSSSEQLPSLPVPEELIDLQLSSPPELQSTVTAASPAQNEDEKARQADEDRKAQEAAELKRQADEEADRKAKEVAEAVEKARKIEEARINAEKIAAEAAERAIKEAQRQAEEVQRKAAAIKEKQEADRKETLDQYVLYKKQIAESQEKISEANQEITRISGIVEQGVPFLYGEKRRECLKLGVSGKIDEANVVNYRFASEENRDRQKIIDKYAKRFWNIHINFSFFGIKIDLMFNRAGYEKRCVAVKDFFDTKMTGEWARQDIEAQSNEMVLSNAVSGGAHNTVPEMQANWDQYFAQSFQSTPVSFENLFRQKKVLTRATQLKTEAEGRVKVLEKENPWLKTVNPGDAQDLVSHPSNVAVPRTPTFLRASSSSGN